MPVIYSLVHGIVFSCSGALLVTGILVFAFRKKPFFRSFIFIVGTLQILAVLLFILHVTLGYQIQAHLAVPYIQQALNEQCPDSGYLINEQNFYVDSGFHWKSDDGKIHCVAPNSNWTCICTQ